METTMAWPWLLPCFSYYLQHLLWLLSEQEALREHALVESKERLCAAQASFLPSGCTTTTASAHGPWHGSVAAGHGNGFNSSIMTALLQAAWDNSL